MNKPTKTAAELAREFEQDPEYRARREEQEKRLALLAAETAADERLLVEEIRNAGYDVDSVWDLANNAPHPVLERRFIGPYPDAYEILVRHLPLPHHPRIREGIIRSLTVNDGGAAVENALLAEFTREADPLMRWVLANALRTAMPYHRRKKYPEIREVLKAGL